MNAIEKYRKKNGISQSTLADILGVTQGTISQWEKGVTSPTVSKLSEIAKALNCGIPDLFNEQESEVR